MREWLSPLTPRPMAANCMQPLEEGLHIRNEVRAEGVEGCLRSSLLFPLFMRVRWALGQDN